MKADQHLPATPTSAIGAFQVTEKPTPISNTELPFPATTFLSAFHCVRKGSGGLE